MVLVQDEVMSMAGNLESRQTNNAQIAEDFMHGACHCFSKLCIGFDEMMNDLVSRFFYFTSEAGVSFNDYWSFCSHVISVIVINIYFWTLLLCMDAYQRPVLIVYMVLYFL